MPAMAYTARPAADPALLRRVLGHVPTAVSVITAMTANGPAGMTVGSFTSISLDPPLAGFFATRTSQTLGLVSQAGRFTANVLSESQAAASKAFASSRGSRFEGVDWTQSESGTPHLANALAWIDCTVQSQAETGDHIAVIGAVDRLTLASPGGRPLIFFRGAYCHLDKRSVPRHGDWQLDHYADW